MNSQLTNPKFGAVSRLRASVNDFLGPRRRLGDSPSGGNQPLNSRERDKNTSN
ncbi:uncharacterized protein FOMMEDRAFT_153425 [Fomitiporia mediterranea MF3/22]|uniref:uncharacterized protein n=1 Tax=Fomitiporia mediterranea (strain MF3/22) TaxID=694068 RepID=UPI000440775F|nr:uncharacterized protein FOMMEDRAFT_153425 [Fomitiporia mediterranea MF3/22]EJD06066.1 hypothetical protein FOMMEDRAFT_153425 [Fomitiporia mediterranea MF3/22]